MQVGYLNLTKSVCSFFTSLLFVPKSSVPQIILLILISGFAMGFAILGVELLWQPQVKGIISDSTGSWIYGLLTFGYFTAVGIGNMIVTPICKIFKDNYVKVLFLARLLMGILFFFLAMQSGIIIIYMSVYISWCAGIA